MRITGHFHFVQEEACDLLKCPSSVYRRKTQVLDHLKWQLLTIGPETRKSEEGYDAEYEHAYSFEKSISGDINWGEKTSALSSCSARTRVTRGFRELNSKKARKKPCLNSHKNAR
jgi:hypothetical protein